MSARGGTTGRAAGCPARFGRAGARKGMDGAAGPGIGGPGGGAALTAAAGPGAVSEAGGVAARGGGMGIDGVFSG